MYFNYVITNLNKIFLHARNKGEKNIGNKKREVQIPDTFVLLLFVIIIAAILTYMIPAGAYDVLEDSTFDPVSYHAIERNPATFTDIIISIPQGLASQFTAIFILLLSVGGIEILNKTKTINSGIMKFITTHKKW